MTTINQALINTINSNGYTLNEGNYILSENITINNVNQFFVVNGNNITFDGAGYNITITSSVSSYKGLIQFNSLTETTFTNLVIKNIGLIFNGSLFNSAGILFSPYRALNSSINIFNSYSYGTINSNFFSGGIVGSQTSTSGCHINVINCYHVGDINSFQSGGIFGLEAAKNAGTSIALNCYHLGNISDSSSGGIFGGNAGINNGNTYLINCYSSFRLFGSVSYTSNYVGSKGTYTGFTGNDWDSNVALTSLYTSLSGGKSLTDSVLLNTENYSKLNTNNTNNVDSVILTNLNSLVSNIYGQSPYPSYFSLDKPYCLKVFTMKPFASFNYTDATSKSANCLCIGTKITMKNRKRINIEDILPGDEIITPYGVPRKVLKVGKIFYYNQSRKHDPYLITKDYFTEGLPSEDTYVSGAHHFLFAKAEAELLGIRPGKCKEDRGKGLLFNEARGFGKSIDYNQVCLIKGEKSPYGFYYYHLVIEDNLGFMANNLPSESISLPEFQENFQEINQIEQINSSHAHLMS